MGKLRGESVDNSDTVPGDGTNIFQDLKKNSVLISSQLEYKDTHTKKELLGNIKFQCRYIM